MSEVSKDSSGAPEEKISDQTQDQDVSTASGSEDDSVAYATYRKAIGEKKKLAREREEMAFKLKEIEQERLQSDGKKDELIERLKTEVAEKDSKINKLNSTYAYNVVTAQLKAEAAAMNCKDVDAMIKLASLDDLEVDENFNVDQKSMRSMLEDMKKNRSWLFDAKKAKVADGTPAPVETGARSTKKMSLDEIRNQLARTV